MFARACPPIEYIICNRKKKKDKEIQYSETGSLCIIYMALSSLALYSCLRAKFVSPLSLFSTVYHSQPKATNINKVLLFCTSLISFYAGNLNKNVQKKNELDQFSFNFFLTNLSMFDVKKKSLFE